MNSLTEEQIIAAIVGAVVGLFIGYLMGRRSAPGSEQLRDMEKQLDEARGAKERFERKVNTHFTDTAAKLNLLTDNYRAVYEHLANGAVELCSEDKARAFSALNPPTPEDDDAIDNESVMVEPPRDYAPKTSPDDPGVLNERFGLDGEGGDEEKNDGEESAEGDDGATEETAKREQSA